MASLLPQLPKCWVYELLGLAIFVCWFVGLELASCIDQAALVLTLILLPVPPETWESQYIISMASNGYCCHSGFFPFDFCLLVFFLGGVSYIVAQTGLELII